MEVTLMNQFDSKNGFSPFKADVKLVERGHHQNQYGKGYSFRVNFFFWHFLVDLYFPERTSVPELRGALEEIEAELNG